MKYVLNKKPKHPIVIQGFPGIGLVSTIITKFLLDHLDCETIGYIDPGKLLPLTAIHKGKVVQPITIYYNQKFNLLIIQSLTDVAGFEWEITETINTMLKDLHAEELIVIESVPSEKEDITLYYFSKKRKIKGLTPLKESVIMGITASTLLKVKDVDVTCLFAETHSQMPDSEAAAHVIDVLNQLFKLNVDSGPLMEAAKQFESSLKDIIEKVKSSSSQKFKKEETSYIG